MWTMILSYKTFIERVLQYFFCSEALSARKFRGEKSRLKRATGCIGYTGHFARLTMQELHQIVALWGCECGCRRFSRFQARHHYY